MSNLHIENGRSWVKFCFKFIAETLSVSSCVIAQFGTNLPNREEDVNIPVFIYCYCLQLITTKFKFKYALHIIQHKHDKISSLHPNKITKIIDNFCDINLIFLNALQFFLIIPILQIDNINYFYCKWSMTSQIAAQPNTKDKDKKQEIKTQSRIMASIWAQVYWDTAYIDGKYYIAHPLALDKLMKLQSEIKVQKNKLNLNQKLQSQQANKNQDSITQKSQLQIHRPLSALSRQCKTQINQVKQLKSKIKAEAQLLQQQQKYKKRVQEAKNKRQSKQKQIIPSELKEQQKLKDSKVQKKQESINKSIKKQNSKVDKKSISNERELSNSRHKKSQKSSKNNLNENPQQKTPVNQKNYISFHPDDAMHSPRFQFEKTKTSKFIEKQGQRQESNQNMRNSANHTSKAANKSFVINYKKSPSISNSKDVRQPHVQSRRNLKSAKSASSAASRLQLQTLNKKIKQMQQKLIQVQQRQMEFQEIEKSRVVAHIGNNKSPSGDENPASRQQSGQTDSKKIYDIEVKKHSGTRYDEQLKNQPSSPLQKSGRVQNQNLHSNKSSVNDEDKPLKQRPVYDLTIYKTKKLNLASTTVEYNYTDDWKKVKKQRQQAEQKQRMFEEIAQLKKMIRQLKLERIKQESMIEQLEKKQREKDSINMLLNSKLQQKSMEISKLNSRLPTQKRQKTELQQQIQLQKQKRSQKSKQASAREEQGSNRIIFDSENKISELRKIEQIESPVIRKQKLPPIKSEARTNLKEYLMEKQKQRQSPQKSLPKKDRQIPKLNINTSANPEQTSYRQFHPYPLSRKGIVVREVLNTEGSDKQLKNSSSYVPNASKLMENQQMPYNDKNYQPGSPASTGRKIFQLQFVKKQKGRPQQNEPQQPQPVPQKPSVSSLTFKAPVLPQTPSSSISQKQLLSSAKKICQIFQVNIESDDHIYMKKYKNCIIFKTPDVKKTVVWHYTGKFYIGGWDQNELGEGKKNGHGIEYHPDKYWYIGQFLNGKRNGSGTMQHANGNIYKGQWVQGERQGFGAYLQKASGAIYQGQWREDKKDGKGILKLSQKQCYDGTFVKSIKHGFGIQQFANGDCYKGQYKNGRFHGKGKYYWKNGASYDGNFVQGHRQGIGRWKSSKKDFDIYFGDYKKDKKQGKGQYTWSSGCVFDGYFSNDLKHGEGRVQYPDGRQIRGYWQNGKLIEVDQNIDESQTASNNYQMRQPMNKMTQISSKQLQPSRTLTRM